jgi:hypothetical protein
MLTLCLRISSALAPHVLFASSNHLKGSVSKAMFEALKSPFIEAIFNIKELVYGNLFYKGKN